MELLQNYYYNDTVYMFGKNIPEKIWLEVAI